MYGMLLTPSDLYELEKLGGLGVFGRVGQFFRSLGARRGAASAAEKTVGSVLPPGGVQNNLAYTLNKASPGANITANRLQSYAKSRMGRVAPSPRLTSRRSPRPVGLKAVGTPSAKAPPAAATSAEGATGKVLSPEAAQNASKDVIEKPKRFPWGKAALLGGLGLLGYGALKTLPSVASALNASASGPLAEGGGWSAVPYGYGHTPYGSGIPNATY